MPRLIDLTNQKIGRLTVLERPPDKYTSGGNLKVRWKCQCDCGNITEVSSGELLNKTVKSCGCYNIEKARYPKFYNRKTNQFDMLSKSYGIGYDHKGNRFIFDKEDYALISQFCWYKHHNYFEAKDIRMSSAKMIYLHKLIMNCEYCGRSVIIDHKNGDPSDNRRTNLRIATSSQNNVNRRPNGISGVLGVKWVKDTRMWEVTIKDIYLGSTPDYAEAVRMRAACVCQVESA